MQTTVSNLKSCSFCAAAALLCFLSNAPAQTTNTLFLDTFDDGAGGLATRQDDAGANYGLDIQWRPRIGSQANSYSVLADSILGPALRFNSTSGNLWIIGQFDNDAADEITLGSSSVPATLGGNSGDVLMFSMRVRTTTTLSTGSSIKCGLTLVPGGPLTADPGSDNSWVNLCNGYYMTIPNGVAGQVATCKQTGVTGTTPFGGAAQTVLSTGIAGVNAGMSIDTLAHTIGLQLIRLSPASVKIECYFDGTLVGTATDVGSPYAQFNSVMLLYGASTGYILDDVTLKSTSIDLGYQPPTAVNDSYSVAKNGVLSVAAPGILANDFAYTNAPMTATKLTDPTHGTLSAFNPDGSFVYTPNSNYFGADSFTYRANDAQTNSQTATVTLNVVGNATWLGSTSASWPEPSNWSFGDLPAGQNVRYDNSSTANLTQTLDRNWSITGLTVSNVPGPVTVASGFTLTNSGAINMANAGADLTILADYAVSGSSSAAIGAGRTLTLSNVWGSLNNAAGPGTLRLQGTITGTLLDLTGSLTLLLDGGTVTGTPPVRLAAEAGGTVRVVVTNNGTLDLNGGNASKINVGNNASTTGMNVFSMESGVLKVAATSGTGTTANNGIFVANSSCFGVFNLNGGTVVMTNKQTVATNTASETTLRVPANAAGNGTVNLNGGVLYAPQIDSVVPSTGSGVLNFNGTIVVANRSNDTWIAGVPNAYVLPGGAIFDSSSNDVTIAQNLSVPASGPSGGLTKRGTGVLRLSGYNSYTGPTVLAEGSLLVAAASSSYPSGSPLVASNGTSLHLDVSGGMTIAMPEATLNGVTLNLNYAGLSGNPGAAAINSASYTGIQLSAAGVNVINIAGSGFAAGDVPLIDYSGSIGGEGFGAFRLGTLPLGLSGTLVNDTANSVIVLRLNRAPNSLVWFGDKSANWDTTTANWNNGLALYTEVGGLGDIVTFDDSLDLTATRTNINLAGALKPVRVFVNSYGSNYRFSGAGKLSGPGSLGKDGTGSLTLTTPNDYSGGSFLTNGVVYLSSDSALGVGPITLVGGTLSSDGVATRSLTNSVTFTVPLFSPYAGIFGDGVNSGPVAISGPVSWSGSACNVFVNNNVVFSGVLSNGGLDVKSGPGTLTFQNATDAMTLGNLQIEDGSVIVSSGTLDRTRGGIRIMAAGSAAQRAYFGILGGATVLLDGPAINVRVGSVGDSSSTNILDIAGTLTCTANDVNGAVQIGTNSALAQVNLRAGGLLRVNAFTVQGPNSEVNFYGGTLAGTANHARFMEGLGGCYLRAGGLTVDTEGLSGQALSLTIAQALQDGGGGGLTKTGQGFLILAGTNSYTGTTTVRAGTLTLATLNTGPGAFTVQDGATLGFFPPLVGATVSVGSVTLGSATGATVAVTFPGAGNPAQPAAAVGTLVLNGALRVSVQAGGLDTGTIPLLSYNTLTGSGPVTTGTLPAGVLGTVTNDTGARMLKLVITRVPPATVVFSDTFEPDGATVATRNDDAGSGFGADLQWRPRGNNQGANYSVTNDAVFGNALQFNNSGSLFTIGQFDLDCSDGVTLGSNSVPVTLGPAVGQSLKFSTDFRTTAILNSGAVTKFGLFCDTNGPTPVDTTTGNGFTSFWFGYFLTIPNRNPGSLLLYKEHVNYDSTDTLMKANLTNVVRLTNGVTGASVAVGADTNRHTLTVQLTRCTNSWVQLDAYWDTTLAASMLDTNPPPFTNFNTFSTAFTVAGNYVYDNVAMSTIKPLPEILAAGDDYSTGMDQALVVPAPGVLGNDSDPSAYALNALGVTGPAHGTLALSGDGAFTYTPASGYSGPDSFTYVANNGFIGSSITTVNLSVTNDAKVPPVLTAGVSGSDLVLSATGGTPGATAWVLTSTNVALPLSGWIVVSTNVLDGSGSLVVTNAMDPAQPRLFFRVQMP